MLLIPISKENYEVILNQKQNKFLCLSTKMIGHSFPYQDSLPEYTSSKKGIYPSQTCQNASYKTLKTRESINLHNVLPYDRNWGRSTNWFPLFVGGGYPVIIQDHEIPSNPFAVYRDTDYRYLSHDPPSRTFGFAPPPIFHRQLTPNQ